jgi:hypothetical protein
MTAKQIAGVILAFLVLAAGFYVVLQFFASGASKDVMDALSGAIPTLSFPTSAPR